MDMNLLQDELNKLDIACDNITVLQDKEGIIVARIVSGEKSYAIKHFIDDIARFVGWLKNPDIEKKIVSYG